MTFEYVWPLTKGLFNCNYTEDVLKAIRDNDVYHISEKFHGCNLCISNKGYISSRKTIIATETDTLTGKRFQNVRLDGFVSNYLRHIYDLKSTLVDCDETLYFGELILNGIATSPFDVFNYHDQNVFSSEMYFFGVGFVSYDRKDLSSDIKKCMNNVQLLTTASGKPYYISLINPLNEHILRLAGLPTVKFYKSAPLLELLTNFTLIEPLNHKLLEGYVLHNENASTMLKWKFVERQSTYIDDHLTTLENAVVHNVEEKKAIMYLRELYQNSTKFVLTLDKTVVNEFLTHQFPIIKLDIVNDLINIVSLQIDMQQKVKNCMNNYLEMCFHQLKPFLLLPTTLFLNKSVELECKQMLLKKISQAIHAFIMNYDVNLARVLNKE